MKYILLVALLFVACGQNYHTLTLVNTSTELACVTLYTDGEQKMSAWNGQTETQAFAEDTYTFDICINLYHPDTLTLSLVEIVDITQDVTCIAFDGDELIKWE